MSDDHNDPTGICVSCQLKRALTEWRDSGAPVEEVVAAITDVVQNIVFAALDEFFEDPDEPTRPALDG